MDRVSVFSILVVMAAVWGYIPYIRSILKRTTKPTLSAWLSWLSIDMVIIAAMISKHSIVWQMFVYAAGSIIVIILCLFKRASLEWKALDSLCVGLVIMAMFGWYFTGDANVAIVISIIANTVGSIPMLRNLWIDPHNESLECWLYALLASTFGVLAIPSMTIAYALAPIAFLLFPIGTIYLICRRHH